MRISDWSSDVCSSDLTTGKASSASLVRGNAAGELARKALISSIAWARVSCTEQKLVTQICICEGSRPTDLAASRKSAICCASLSSCLAPENRITPSAISPASFTALGDRKRGVSGKSVSVRVDLGGGRIIKKKKKKQKT